MAVNVQGVVVHDSASELVLRPIRTADRYGPPRRFVLSTVLSCGLCVPVAARGDGARLTARVPAARAYAGSIWFQISENSLYVQNTLGVLFMTVALLSFVSFSSVPQYIEQRSIYNRCLP
jgi:hypothetical protein